MQLGLAVPDINHPSDVIGNLYFEDDIIAETLPVEDGFALLVIGRVSASAWTETKSSASAPASKGKQNAAKQNHARFPHPSFWLLP